MNQQTATFSKHIGGDLFEIFRISFDGVREKAGFQRSVRTTRHQYRFNGKVVPKADWFALKDAAKTA